ncbi:hypothetical protein SLA2020_285430 [Shorea laevis]
MNIISTLKHKHIATLIGVCVEDNFLISVYDFFPMGSLEENLHGHDNRSALPWEVRFKVAVAVAEALNYLHNECSPPIIHRDVNLQTFFSPMSFSHSYLISGLLYGDQQIQLM